MINHKIVEYTTKLPKPARRNQPSLPAGSKLWLIEYPTNPIRYFYCGYELKVSAAKVADRLEGTKREIKFNSKLNPEQTLHFMGKLND